jgi:hypothetical protein
MAAYGVFNLTLIKGKKEEKIKWLYAALVNRLFNITNFTGIST